MGQVDRKARGQPLVLALNPTSKNADGADGADGARGGNVFHHARLMGSSLKSENYVISQLDRSYLTSPARL